MAAAPLAAIPLVGIADRKRAGTVEILELLARQVGRHVIHADRRLLVAFARFLDAVLAERHVVVGDQLRRAVLIGVDVETRAAGVDHQSVCLVLVELQHVAGQAVIGRTLALRAQPGERVFAQVRDAALGHRLQNVAEGLERPCAREQQVAAHEIGEAEVRVVGDQRIHALQRHVELVRLDRQEDL